MEMPHPPWFRATVAAIVEVVAEPFANTPALQPPLDDVTDFVLRQHADMPDYLRGPLKAATLGFDALGLLKRGKPFHRQSMASRKRAVAAWKNSSIGVQRDLIRYVESLATFALFSREGAPPSAAHPAPPAGGTSSSSAADLRAQIVVIGSGPGGAITACLLAEAGREVLLVEEGPHLSLASCAAFSREEMLQKYRNGGQTVTMGRNKINYVEGRCVGGGSEINSALYHRTPAEILERWRKEFQVEGLSDGEMLPHFEAGERDVCVTPLPGPAPAASLKLHEGATRLGWRSLEIPRWMRYQETDSDPPKGIRQSMTESYLPRFLRAGGRLLPETRVARLRREGAGWSIEARERSGKAIRLLAESVFLCAGAVQTPALLRRSGITHHVGDSFQVHPTVKLVAQFRERVNADGMGVPVHQVKQFEPRLSLGCSISSPAHLALALLDHPDAAGAVLRDWEKMAVYYAAITGESSGTVRPLPGFRDPLVRYTITQGDRRALADGLRKLAEALFASGAAVIYPCPGACRPLRSPADLGGWPEVLANGAANLMTVHLFSSCPMGENPARCAADSFGRLHQMRDLYINDASLLCSAPGVNPQGSVMALARRNAFHFLHQSTASL